MSRLFLIRHGATEWSVTGRHTGRTDISLTEDGRRQAKRLGGRLARERFELVLTSPLSRALETCHLAGFAAVAERVDELLEWDYGAYDGLTTEEIRTERPGWTLWTGGVPGGETAMAVGARVDRVIERVRSLSGDVALFAHGHVLRVLAARLLGQPPEAGALYHLSTATISVLGWERQAPVIELWNDACHLHQG